MQDDHVGRAAALALAVVRRRSHLGDDGGFGTQLGRNHTRTARTFAGATSCTRRKAPRVRSRRLCRNDDARQAHPRRACVAVAAKPRRLLRASRTLKKRDGRAGLSPTRPSNFGTPFVPLTLLTRRSQQIRYSLIGPDNTRLG